ncbi:hypothetical protein BCR41DRAFT_362518 [Lobosporangium transversale]|uniref:Uncharacterized protein n=1 Tax=Lobosporangium transversale TaxID=64571 RepID=A0A1Y2G9E7_9FUNG|nr:hypothetical protein BCR41DRAFT_362518 [Lobosporangium transversale]ORZ04691.1 hypothetical protein BCR41DRAFT_362518 [Lobosporangium transversale]|eukprot:XP_021876688.1 hypothetical protein BCR41DRAFT_362518 [Lobosporangium transversale]
MLFNYLVLLLLLCIVIVYFAHANMYMYSYIFNRLTMPPFCPVLLSHNTVARLSLRPASIVIAHPKRNCFPRQK